MKPTRGVLGGDPPAPAWLGLVVYGALARTVRDSALLLDVLHGDVPAGAPPPGSFREATDLDPGRLRIAISPKLPPGLVARLHRDQREAWEQTAALLSELGHNVSERDPAYGGAQIDFVQTWVRGIYEQSRAVPEKSKLERLTRQMAGAGRYLVPPPRRAALLAKRPATTARILALWNETDVLLTPGLARTPILAQGASGKTAPVAIDLAGRLTPYTPVFNVTGQPAIALPAGFDSDGLPLSVQLVGRPGAERTLYALAAQLEAARPWAQHRPPLS
jgi:amidase